MGGITSIIFSFSESFLPKWKNWTSDFFKTIKMLLCFIILAIHLMPFGLTFGILFETEKCPKTSPIIIMILDFFLLICFALSWLDGKRIARMLISVILFLLELVTLTLALVYPTDAFVPKTCSAQVNYAVYITIVLLITGMIYHTIM